MTHCPAYSPRQTLADRLEPLPAAEYDYSTPREPVEKTLQPASIYSPHPVRVPNRPPQARPRARRGLLQQGMSNFRHNLRHYYHVFQGY
jgi:hypothetical protein